MSTTSSATEVARLHRYVPSTHLPLSPSHHRDKFQDISCSLPRYGAVARSCVITRHWPRPERCVLLRNTCLPAIGTVKNHTTSGGRAGSSGQLAVVRPLPQHRPPAPGPGQCFSTCAPYAHSGLVLSSWCFGVVDRPSESRLPNLPEMFCPRSGRHCLRTRRH